MSQQQYAIGINKYGEEIKYILDMCHNLYLPKANLISLDLSNCKDVKQLDVMGNYLTKLDISECKCLAYLNCVDNKLTSLNIPTGLSSISCDNILDVELVKHKSWIRIYV